MKAPVSDNAAEIKNSDEQTTPTQATDKQAEITASPLISATQRHLPKSVDVATIKQGPAKEGTKNVRTANASKDVYIVKETRAEESALIDNWIIVHEEFHNWPRSLIIDHNIKLTLANDQRKAFLEELASAEREGRPAFDSELSGSECEEACKKVCESMWSDIKTIRKAVNTGWVRRDAVETVVEKAKQVAKAQGKSPPEAADLLPMPTEKTLGQVIDPIEGREGFEDAVDKDNDSVMSDER